MRTLTPQDVAAAIKQVRRGEMSKRQLGRWAHRALLDADAGTTPVEWRYRGEISKILLKLMFLDEELEPGEFGDMSDAELDELVQQLDRMAQQAPDLWHEGTG